MVKSKLSSCSGYLPFLKELKPIPKSGHKVFFNVIDLAHTKKSFFQNRYVHIIDNNSFIQLKFTSTKKLYPLKMWSSRLNLRIFLFHGKFMFHS